MFYTALLWLVVAAHFFAFLIYLPSGGFLGSAVAAQHLAARRRRAVGVGSVVLHLVPVDRTRAMGPARAGMPPLKSGGFIDHYVSWGQVSSGGTGYAQTAAFTAVLVSWFLYAMTARRRSVTDGERARVGAVVPHRGGTR